MSNQMDILSDNWTTIVNKVIRFQWNTRFKKAYEKAKLDYDDFESMAGYELTKAIYTYDETKSSITTFAADVVSKKALTEIRDWTQRDKRRASVEACSIFMIVNNETGATLEDEICNICDCANNDFETDNLKDVILRELKQAKERELIERLMDGYSIKETALMLRVDEKWINAIRQYIANCSNVRRVARKCGFLGGINDEI